MTTVTYAPDLSPHHHLTEQLRLFAFQDEVSASADGGWRALTKRERLAALLAGELDFHKEDSGYASHDLHAFAAKFPPQLPRAFIRGLTEPGDIVLDPMMGSGTTVVEALLAGRRGIGLDLDPLAVRLGQVKTTPCDLASLRAAGERVIAQAQRRLAAAQEVDAALATAFDARTREFVDYWFLPQTQRELMALVLSIRAVDDPFARRFLELTFSSIIITKSGGVARARDLAHSRPHLDIAKVPKNALEQFAARLRKNLASAAHLRDDGPNALVLTADARTIPLASGVVDLVVTSPPYANAIDYMRAHKFSLVWLNHSIGDLSALRAEYIGAERMTDLPPVVLPERAEQVLAELAQRDRARAQVLRKYFCEMRDVLAEILRVLRGEGAAVIVVGSSTMRAIDVQTHYCLADIAATLGFDVVGVARRALDRNRRMMPARFGRKSDSMIEQRMHEEYVIGLLKPPLLSHLHLTSAHPSKPCRASTPAPITPAREPSSAACTGVDRTWGMACAASPARIALRNGSPTSATPPPTTIASGSMAFTNDASAMPSQRPASSNA